MRRVTNPVTVPEAKRRALAYLCALHERTLAKASEVADAIWTDKPFLTGQGAGAAAGRILRAMQKDGTVIWHSTDTNWGYRASDFGHELHNAEARA